jgi:hypothetical protein
MLEHGHAQHLTLLRRRPTKHRALLDAAYQAASAKARVRLDRVADQGQRVELWAGANPKTFEPENLVTGGWGGIRTLETLARLPVFKTGAFNHSATHPYLKSTTCKSCSSELAPNWHRNLVLRKALRQLRSPPPLWVMSWTACRWCPPRVR